MDTIKIKKLSEISEYKDFLSQADINDIALTVGANKRTLQNIARGVNQNPTFNTLKQIEFYLDIKKGSRS